MTASCYCSSLSAPAAQATIVFQDDDKRPQCARFICFFFLSLTLPPFLSLSSFSSQSRGSWHFYAFSSSIEGQTIPQHKVQSFSHFCVCVCVCVEHGATYPSITHGFVSSSRFFPHWLELRIERGKRKANGQEKGVVDHPPTPGPPATGLLNPHKTHPDSM